VLKALFGYLAVLMISLWVSPMADATTLVLNSGERITGNIIEHTELRIMVDVGGTPKTFFLGEISSIDGKAMEMPREAAVEMTLADVGAVMNRPPAAVVPYYKDEQDSLVRFMSVRSGNAAPAASSPAPAPSQEQSAAPPASGGTDRSVVSTSDGGIIVVTSNKITKYDHDFKVIKEVNLTAVPAVAPQ